MKKLIPLLRAALLSTALFALYSCNPLDDVFDSDYKWTDNGNTATASYSWNFWGTGASLSYTFTFDGNDICTNAVLKTTYPSATDAQETWEDMSETERAKSSISGKTITTNETEDFQGLTREEVKAITKAAAEATDIF